MYLNGTHRNTCKIHAGYMQDTSGYVLYRKPPPICIGNPPSPQSVEPDTGQEWQPTTIAMPTTHRSHGDSAAIDDGIGGG